MPDWRVLAAMVAACVAVMAPSASARACPDAHARLRDDNAAKVRKAVICVVNERRAEAGLKKLRINRRLGAAAAAHSDDMVAADYFAHDEPDGDTILTRALRAGYLDGKERAYGLAENLAMGKGGRATAAGLVKQWMNSAPHRLNILLARSRDAGVGLAQGQPGGAKGVTATLDFGYAR